jgi:hypothetical protein
MKSNQSTHNQGGVSALEFTILAPLVFVLVFGMIEFGCYFYDRALITNACREGARAGIAYVHDHNTLDDGTDSDIRSRVEGAVNYFLGDYRGVNFSPWWGPSPWPKLIYFGSSTPDPDIDPDINGSNDRLRVEVRWTYDFLVLPNFKVLGWVDLPGEIEINSVSEMMLEITE